MDEEKDVSSLMERQCLCGGNSIKPLMNKPHCYCLFRTFNLKISKHFIEVGGHFQPRDKCYYTQEG